MHIGFSAADVQVVNKFIMDLILKTIYYSLLTQSNTGSYKQY